MSTDEELGRWLRHELLHHESRRPPSPGLARESLAGARQAERRRTRLVAVGAASAAAAVVVAAVVVATPERLGGSELPPAGSPTETTRAPSDPTDSSAALLPGVWASTLPAGAPPEVAYATQTALHLPSGQVVDLGGTGAVIIGQTVAGTVLLVEHDGRDNGGEFRSWYDVVSPDGAVRQLDSGRITGARVQEAVVSPDGQWFSDGRIVNMTTGQVTDTLPAEADILHAWTTAGVVYGAGDAAFLWSPERRTSVELDRWPGTYPNGTDIGLGRRDGCPSIERLTTEGAQDEVSRHCGLNPLTVSPNGSWLLTAELVAIDSSTGEERPLAQRPVRDLGSAWDAHWLNEDEVLLSVPGGGYQTKDETAPSDSAVLVRCNLDSGTCERATKAISRVGPNLLLSLP